MKTKLLAVLMILGGLLAACGDDNGGEAGSSDDAAGSGSDEPSGEPFRILAVLPLSGALSTQGEILHAGLEVAVEELNEDGGILGGEVELQVIDDATDPTKATTLLQEALSSGERPHMVSGGAGSAELLAMLPLISREGLFSMGITASAPGNDVEANPYHFNMVHPPSANMAAIVPFAEEEGWDKLGFFVSNDALGESNTEAMRAGVEGTDIELVVESFTPTDLDLTSPLQRMLAHEPDAVFYSTYGASAGLVLEARQKLNATDIPFAGDAAVVASNVANLVDARALENMQLLAVKEAAEVPAAGRPDPERWESMKERIKAKVGTIEQTLSIGSYGYQQVMLTAWAAEKAGSTDPAAMTEAIENITDEDFEGSRWVNFVNPGYDDSGEVFSHAVEAVEGDYVLVPAAALVDGLIPNPDA